MPRPLDLRGMTAADLRRILIPAKLPEAEEYRRYYGRGLNPGQIEMAMRQASSGLFVDLTDLEDEALALDPHASGVLAKRFGSLACLPWTVDEAEGRDVDPVKAGEYADQVRRNLEQIPNFERHIYHLAWANYYNRAATEIHWSGPHPRGEVRFWAEGFRDIHPRRLAFGAARELLLIDTFKRYSGFTSDQGVPLDAFPGKFITWIPRSFSTYPESDGLGPRILYWSFFKRFSWRMRMQLTELFGIPWRIIQADAEQGIDWEKLSEAAAQVERLGRTNTAQLPPGAKLEVVFPGEQSGNLFQMTNEDVDRQVSKLVLGNTGTTEGNESNRANSIIQKGEQDIILSLDAGGLSWRIQRCFVEPFVAFNHGPDEVRHAPRFRLRAEPPRDVAADIANAQNLLALGLPLAEAQLRERAGWRAPDDGEAYVVQGPGGGVDAMGNPLPASAKLVDPKDQGEAINREAAAAGLRAPDPDELAAAAGDLEEGGEDEAVANAVADLLAATGINMTHDARHALGVISKVQGRGVATDFALHVLAERGEELVRADTLRQRARRLELRRLERTAVALGVTNNHGHEVPELGESLLASSNPGAGGSLRISIKGEGDHDHLLELDTTTILAIQSGQVARATSSEGPDGHRHEVTIAYPVELEEVEAMDAYLEEAGRGESHAKLVEELRAMGLEVDAARRVAVAHVIHHEGRHDHDDRT